MKPLFVPLRKIYFTEFADGLKTTEFRVLGPRWNDRVCFAGRPVVLSCGYSGPRILTSVAAFSAVDSSSDEHLSAFFGAGIMLAAIRMALCRPAK